MIKAENVSLVYSDGTIGLREFNLNISQGETIYITGPSGSGKTSLLKLLIGIESPTTGELFLFNQSMNNISQSSIRKLRREIGIIFQEFKIIKGRSSYENVMMGLRFLNIPPKEMKERAIKTLEDVGLGHKIYAKVENLSWGENQRVAIARALARKPKLILADEPTGNLDLDNAHNILDLLISLKDQDTTVIITTHATHLIENIEEGTFISVRDGYITVEKVGVSND